MPDLSRLLDDVATARCRLLTDLTGVSADHGSRKPAPDAWSLQEVVEHLVLAERMGFDLVWTAAERLRAGDPVWAGESPNAGLAIEQVIDRTWQDKETAPPQATPTGQLSLGLWRAHLASCDDLLARLAEQLDGLPLEQVIYPHFLCGPLDAVQRLQFIRFHIDRHRQQIRAIREAVG